MSNLTYIIILAIVIIVVSIINAFGKAVGSGANVKDFFLDESDKKEQKPDDKISITRHLSRLTDSHDRMV